MAMKAIELFLGLLTMVMGFIILLASIALEIANRVMRDIYENRSCKYRREQEEQRW